MNTYFQFKQFTIHQEHCAMKVSTDSCLFGAWVASRADGVMRALDVGAGTGLLSLMLAQQSKAFIDAIEIERDCFTQMQDNVSLSPWAKRINCIFGDVRSFSFPQPYDLIISNPPFYEKQLNSPSSLINAARHSSTLTLNELMQKNAPLLTENGLLALLLPYSRHEELMRAAGELGLYPREICLARHSPKHPWYRTMVLFSTQRTSVNSSSIDIRDIEGVYSETYSTIMKDFYLNPTP